MNLLEVMMASVLFAFSAGSSLQIWSLICRGEQQQQQRQQRAERLEAELASLEGLLRQQSRQAELLPPCGQGATRLAQLIQAQPAGAGVVRRISPLDLEDGLLVELAIEAADAGQAAPLQRRRLYRPAALGLCLPLTTPVTPAPSPLPAAGGSHGLS